MHSRKCDWFLGLQVPQQTCCRDHEASAHVSQRENLYDQQDSLLGTSQPGKACYPNDSAALDAAHLQME